MKLIDEVNMQNKDINQFSFFFNFKHSVLLEGNDSVPIEIRESKKRPFINDMITNKIVTNQKK